jgi:hypothetical protein
LAGLNISIPNGNMKVEEIDGGNSIVPSPAVDSIGTLYPGERMDIIISTNQAISLTVALDEEYTPHFHHNSHAHITQIFHIPKSGSDSEPNIPHHFSENQNPFYLWKVRNRFHFAFRPLYCSLSTPVPVHVGNS